MGRSSIVAYYASNKLHQVRSKTENYKLVIGLYQEDQTCWVVLEEDQPSGSTYLLKADWATGSTYI